MHTAQTSIPCKADPKQMYRAKAGLWIVDASELDLPIGRWPQWLSLVNVEGGPYRLPFLRRERNADGDITVMIYQSTSKNPITIHVLND